MITGRGGWTRTKRKEDEVRQSLREIRGEEEIKGRDAEVRENLEPEEM